MGTIDGDVNGVDVGAGGVQGKLATPFIFEHVPSYRNTWKFHPNFLASINKNVEITLKIDGGCYWLDGNGKWWGRRDLKPYLKKGKKNEVVELTQEHFDQALVKKIANEPAMAEWIPCDEPDFKGGHWFGWIPILADPNLFQYAIEAVNNANFYPANLKLDQTYELIGPKIQNNPYQLAVHALILHGSVKFEVDPVIFRSVEGIRKLFMEYEPVMNSEGVVIHIDDNPVWKIHHGHIHDGNDELTNNWKKQVYIPDEFKIFQAK